MSVYNVGPYMHPNAASIAGNPSAQGSPLDDSISASPKTEISSQEASTVACLHDANGTSEFAEFLTYFCYHRNSGLLSSCGSLSATTTPRSLQPRCAACAFASNRHPEQKQWRGKSEGYSQSEIFSSFSGEQSQFGPADPRLSNSVLADEYDQLDPWVNPSAAQTPSINSPSTDAVPALSRPHPTIGERQPSSSPPVDPNPSRSGPTQHGGPYAFQNLPGYCGKRNDENRFECFGDCRKRRLGRHGFGRRSNLLVHLRNCHGQQVPKYDREKSKKIRATYKQNVDR
ncbi:uncharacterized protein LAJ45_01024 [Morchella importuna]|uniref:uncharacterized protein n=1 Tax=Morchella importuna TaxID=1174673 RepID=UPI001E8E14C8|nr:uncharacterized protein LAJ45_01024 [Morchella importuna]KAH8154496.1 hypothetical protein LAJ45_01024 [Morchella importuna]